MNIGHEKLEVTSWMCTRNSETQQLSCRPEYIVIALVKIS